MRRMLPKTDGRELPLFAPERWGITSWVSAIKAADNFHANTHSGREFGDTLNRVKFRFSKANCCGSDHVVHLLGFTRADNCAGHGRMAQGPGDRDRAWETVVALADRA